MTCFKRHSTKRRSTSRTKAERRTFAAIRRIKGARKQSSGQKADLSFLFAGHNDYKDCDYVVGWFLKAAQYLSSSKGRFAFVATNSIAQGEQVAHLWSRLFEMGMTIEFAHRTFLWRNNAADNAGVHCVVVGVTSESGRPRRLFDGDTVRNVDSISPYLTPGEPKFVEAAASPISADLAPMLSGNMARDGGHLFLSPEEAGKLVASEPRSKQFLKRAVGTKEINQGNRRFCLWIDDACLPEALSVDQIRDRVQEVKRMRVSSPAKTTRAYASIPHKFAQRCHRDEPSLAVPKTTTGLSAFLTPCIYDAETVITDLAFVSYPMNMVGFAIISSTLHLVWAKTVAGGMRDGLRYSSQLAYHTFPLPRITEKNRTDLARTATEILLARESHFPASIANLYDAESMPDDLRAAHERNDEVLERIYIGRRFKNDTERLEKLFDLYTKLTAAPAPPNAKQRRVGAAV